MYRKKKTRKSGQQKRIVIASDARRSRVPVDPNKKIATRKLYASHCELLNDDGPGNKKYFTRNNKKTERKNANTPTVNNWLELPNIRNNNNKYLKRTSIECLRTRISFKRHRKRNGTGTKWKSSAGKINTYTHRISNNVDVSRDERKSVTNNYPEIRMGTQKPNEQNNWEKERDKK